eukprot:956899-Ditylum_brightwellii.AAC.1
MDDRPIHCKIEELTGLVEDVHQIKFLYTLINTYYRLGYLGREERKNYTTRALKKVVLDKTLRDGAIDDYTSKWLDREAEVCHTSHAPFVKDIWNNLNMLEARIKMVETRMNKIETRVQKLEQVTTDVVRSLQQLQKGIRFHRKADIAVGMMTA